jgi:hypothetical protein
VTQINVCHHVIDKTEKPEFLFAHLGQVIAAACYRCEPVFDSEEDPRESWPRVLKPLTIEQAAELGIPATIPNKAEAAVFSNP